MANFRRVSGQNPRFSLCPPQVAQCSAEEESFTYRWYKTQWSRLWLNISSSHSPPDSWWCSDDMSRPPQLASSLLVSVSIILFWENIIKSICSLTRLILNCLIRLRTQSKWGKRNYSKLELDLTMSQSWIELGNWIRNFNFITICLGYLKFTVKIWLGLRLDLDFGIGLWTRTWTWIVTILFWR